jgi:hypothetical protein
MYKYPAKCNETEFFWWPNSTIKTGEWAKLPPVGKAVFPVLACYANRRSGVAFPSELTIAALSGYSEKKVREGLKSVEGFSLMEKVERYITNSGNNGKKYHLCIPKNQVNDGRFRFFRYILESGWWRKMTRDAKAVYPVMRCFTTFDPYDYGFIEDIEEDPETVMQEYYPNREYDICRADLSIIADHAGLTIDRLRKALVNLADCYLLDDMELVYEDEADVDRVWRIFIKPKDKTILKRSFLEGELSKSFGYTIKKQKLKKPDNVIPYSNPRAVVDNDAKEFAVSENYRLKRF